MDLTHQHPTTRAWDLAPGDTFHGRTIAAVHGMVGLALSPVAVFSFTEDSREHRAQARIGAAHCETHQHYDEIMLSARAWVRTHGLREGDALDLHRLRTEVMAAAARN
ncbi:hypothetical protein [Kocuria nitroreducens]|uniref:hypothetical protein n=1 Tax=Kocuria nitroreducens TaxID=3058914 RepID=UPI0036DE1033